MNGDELKAQQTKSVWINLNPRERVSSRWHARGQEFESPYLHQLVSRSVSRMTSSILDRSSHAGDAHPIDASADTRVTL